jgi:hypothetical protein
MNLPFSHDAFLDVFGAYNASLWPAVVLLWLLTAVLVFQWLRTGLMAGRLLFSLLAIHWAWSGIAYHWFFFRSINPAAAVFAVLFIIQAAVFVWLAVVSRGSTRPSADLRGIIGAALVVYGLAYPLVGIAFGLEYPRLPLFAVPCPTALITAGLLVTATDVPRLVNAVPILWAAIGSSAAFILGIRADLALVVAGAILAVDTLAPLALGRRA